MDPTQKLTKGSGYILADPSTYRRLIGRLLYLTHTKPDIAFVVTHLSQFMHSPCDLHMQAVLRIVKYLKGSPAEGLFFSASSSPILKGYSDSD